MASSSSLLSEDQLRCSICLDVFTDPVSTPCEHNFCMICLNIFWDNRSPYQCPVCKEEFQKRPELHINTFIAKLAAQFRNQVPRKNKVVLCDSCSEKKLEAVKSCLHCGVSYCSIHLKPHHNTPNLCKHNLMDPVKNLKDNISQKQKAICREDKQSVRQVCAGADHEKCRTSNQEAGEKKAELWLEELEVEQMIDGGMMKTREIKHSFKLCNKIPQKAESVEIFKALTHSIETNQSELLKVMEEKQKAAERQSEEFIKDLEQEITEIKSRNNELQTIFQTEDNLHLLQIDPSLQIPSPTKNSPDQVQVNPELSVATLIRTKIQESLDKEMEKHHEMKLQSFRQPGIIVDVTLDPDTAHPDLIVSADRKQVRHGDKRQNVSDNPQRFDVCPCVLGKEGFSSGRVYYEVLVRGKSSWVLGLTSKSCSHKGEIPLSPDEGYWCILDNDLEYQACDTTLVFLSLKRVPYKVGVFVDYEEGLISFYDVWNKSHIYSFTNQSFTEELYPFFKPGHNDGGKNSAPLILTPIIKDQL